MHVEMVETLEAYAVYKMGRYEEAFRAWRALAEKGNAQGILNVANMYLAGEGTTKDPKKAVEWYRKGAEQGDPHCLLNLSRAYETGVGVSADMKEAERYLQLAAGAGSTEAQVRVAKRLIEAGETHRARSWLDRAADKGDQGAIALLARLDPSPTVERTSVPTDKRRRIEALLDDMNAAANARDPEWLTKGVSEDADIKVKLPGQPEFHKLSKSGYRDLWDLTFRETERYRFARTDYKIVRSRYGATVHSRIREYLTTKSKSSELLIEETLEFSFTELGEPVVKGISLIVTRAS